MNFDDLMSQEPPELDEDACWNAVVSRDEYSAGAIVYGVRSTRIFCRASCPSRRPKREGVSFFASPQAASQAGFRACKRCHPDQVRSPQNARVARACRVLQARRESPPSLEKLAAQVGAEPRHLQRTFKKTLGLSPREYSDALRLDALKTSLQNGASVLDARLSAGYGSSRGLYERAGSQLGMTPASYGRGGKGASIFFQVAPCALGFVLVAATPRGVCSVALGDAPGVLEAELHREFHAATIQAGAAQLQGEIETVLNYLEGRATALDLPLDVRATAFQWRVWRALRAIDCGRTCSYAQVANHIDAPQSARAVARACASNPVALVVPCHRVVRGDGSLSGYRWGIERKQKLLAMERTVSAPSGAIKTND